MHRVIATIKDTQAMKLLGQGWVAPTREAPYGVHQAALVSDLVEVEEIEIAVEIMMNVEGSWGRPLYARRVIVHM
jgi:hypothetical protein